MRNPTTFVWLVVLLSSRLGGTAGAAAQGGCPASGEYPEGVVESVFVDPNADAARAAVSFPRFSKDDIRHLAGPADVEVCARLLQFVRTVYPPQEHEWHGTFFQAGRHYIVVQWPVEKAESRALPSGGYRLNATRRTAVYLLDGEFRNLGSAGM